MFQGTPTPGQFRVPSLQPRLQTTPTLAVSPPWTSPESLSPHPLGQPAPCTQQPWAPHPRGPEAAHARPVFPALRRVCCRCGQEPAVPAAWLSRARLQPREDRARAVLLAVALQPAARPGLPPTVAPGDLHKARPRRRVRSEDQQPQNWPRRSLRPRLSRPAWPARAALPATPEDSCHGQSPPPPPALARVCGLPPRACPTPSWDPAAPRPQHRTRWGCPTNLLGTTKHFRLPGLTRRSGRQWATIARSGAIALRASTEPSWLS